MNNALFKWHSRLALLACLPLLIICLSGSLLVFKSEIEFLLAPAKFTLPDTGQTPRRSLDELADHIESQYPQHIIGGWEIFHDRKTADRVYLIGLGGDEWYKLTLNPYNNEILAPPVDMHSELMEWILELHYTFLLEINGAIVSAVVSLLFIAIGITGIILYRKFWINFFTLRWHARAIVLYSDLHKRFGLLISPIILITGITGAYFTIVGLYHELVEHAGEVHIVNHKMHSDGISLQALHDNTTSHIAGFTATYLRLPDEEDMAITFYGRASMFNPLLSNYGSTVSFDATSGEFQSKFDIREQGFGYKLLDSFRRLHFGSFGGLPVQILWTLGGLTPAFLAASGIFLWLKRRPQRRRAAEKQRLKRQAGQSSPPNYEGNVAAINNSPPVE